MTRSGGYGYHGQLLFVDLTTGRVTREPRDDAYYRSYLGGYGLGVEVLFRQLATGLDPLGPDALCGFTTGLLTGTNAPFSGRYAVVGKSPLTGGWGDANSGGSFGPMLKRAGVDAVFFTGRADEPVYCHVHDGDAELRDASGIWGQDCYAAETAIAADIGGEHRVKVATIGPAGENAVRFACIMNDHGRAAGRSGLGAVMGAKNLKGVAVSGSARPTIADPAAFKRLRKQLVKLYTKQPTIMHSLFPFFKPLLPSILKRGIFPSVDEQTQAQMFKEHGTTSMAAISSQCGDSPIKNWQGIGFRDFPMRTHANRISDTALDRYKIKRYACSACPLGCGALFELPAHEDGSGAGDETHRPEYETIAEFGMMLLNNDPEVVIHASDLCNRLGMDTISAGGTIAFAYECYDRGLLGPEQLGTDRLEWGDGEPALRLLQKIAAREGVGDLLAEGTMRAAAALGGDAHEAAVHIGGQELPMHDPRLNPSFATTYLTDPTPGRHTQGGAGFYEWGLIGSPVPGIKLPKIERYSYTGKGYVQGFLSRAWQVINALGLCMFGVQFHPYPMVEMVNAVTGWDLTLRELLDTGERIQALRQAFNVREGLIASQLEVPARAVGRPQFKRGPTAFVTVDVETMAKEYYEDMHWDWSTGRPDRDRLDELGLGWVNDALDGAPTEQ